MTARRLVPELEPEPKRNGRLIAGICMSVLGAFTLFLTAKLAFEEPDENRWSADDLDFEPWHCMFPLLVLAIGAVLIFVEARSPKRRPTA